MSSQNILSFIHWLFTWSIHTHLFLKCSCNLKKKLRKSLCCIRLCHAWIMLWSPTVLSFLCHSIGFINLLSCALIAKLSYKRILVNLNFLHWQIIFSLWCHYFRKYFPHIQFHLVLQNCEIKINVQLHILKN